VAAAARPADRTRWLTWLLALLAAVGVVVAVPGTALAGPNEDDFFSAVNSARAANGVPGLAWSSDLAAVARHQAERMAASGDLAHNPNLGSDVTGWQIVAENIGYGPTWSSIQDAFMASPEHKANILDSRLTQLGVGTAVDADGTVWVSQVFRLPFGASVSAGGSSAAGTAPAASTGGAPAVTVAPPPSPEELLRERIRTVRAAVAGHRHHDDPLSEALDFSTVMAAVAS